MAHAIYPEFWTYTWPKNYFCHNIKRMSSLYKEYITKPFEDPEKSADAIKEKILQNPSEYYDDTFDNDYVGMAEEYAFCEYGIIKDMQYRARLLWICCIFEMWEQNLSHHIVQDLDNSKYPLTETQKNRLFGGFNIFKTIFSKKMFTEAEYECILKDFPRFKELEEMHFLVNAIKHGRGQSLTSLLEKYKKYKMSERNVSLAFKGTTIYSQTLNVTDDDFYRFCNVLIDFWKWIPAHIVITNIAAFEQTVPKEPKREGKHEV